MNLNAKTSFALFITVLMCAPTNAFSQSVITSAIMNAVGSSRSSNSGGCFPDSWDDHPKKLAKFEREARPALDKYLALVASGKSPIPAFKQRPTRHWSLDGQEVKKFDTIKDPWADKIGRIENVNLTLDRFASYGQGIWRAYDQSGSLLGTYDAMLVIASEGYRLVELSLWSPSNQDRVQARFEPCSAAPPTK